MILRRSVILTIVMFLVMNLSGAATKEELFDAGVDKYLQRDLRGAVTEWRKALLMDTDDKKTKEVLVNALIILGKNALERKDIQVANSYFGYAFQMSPEQEELRALKLIAEMEEQFPDGKEIPHSELSTEKEEGAIMAILLRAGVKKSVQEAKPVIIKSESVMDRKLLKQLFMEQQESMTNLYSGLQGTLEDMGKKFEEERDDYMEILKKSSARQGRINLGIFLIGAGIVVAVLLLSIFFGFSIFGRKVQRVIRQMLVVPRPKLLKEGLEFVDESVGALLGSSNPWIRAKGVELLGKELIGSNNPNVAEKVLDSYLKDENHLVRANASKVLYLVNPERAMKFLSTMMDDDDSWMRVSGARVLGQIGSPESARILMGHLVDADYNVKRMILLSLKKVLTFDSRKEGFTPEIVEEIKKAVEGIQFAEGWIV